MFENYEPEEHQTFNFLFLLDQKLMKIEEEISTIDNISRTILDCVDRIAPEQYTSYRSSPLNDCINNTIKNAMTKRDILFQQSINDPKRENQDIYRCHVFEIKRKNLM